jgi:hypothetical protein
MTMGAEIDSVIEKESSILHQASIVSNRDTMLDIRQSDHNIKGQDNSFSEPYIAIQDANDSFDGVHRMPSKSTRGPSVVAVDEQAVVASNNQN